MANNKLIVESADNGVIFRDGDTTIVEKTHEDAAMIFGIWLAMGLEDISRVKDFQDTYEVKIINKKTGELINKEKKNA